MLREELDGALLRVAELEGDAANLHRNMRDLRARAEAAQENEGVLRRLHQDLEDQVRALELQKQSPPMPSSVVWTQLEPDTSMELASLREENAELGQRVVELRQKLRRQQEVMAAADSNKENSNPQMNSLAKRLEAKENELAVLKKTMEARLEQAVREQKLITSALYNSIWQYHQQQQKQQQQLQQQQQHMRSSPMSQSMLMTRTPSPAPKYTRKTWDLTTPVTLLSDELPNMR
eukprot:jgi/Chlat1/7960/Chrsp69S07394